MKDIPVFTTQYGVASLVLGQIPYRGQAYIRLQASQEPEKLLDECVMFCRMAGAEEIYATGNTCLESYPMHTDIWRMTCSRQTLGHTDAALFPVQDHTAAWFTQLYNEKIRKVPNAAWMTAADEAQMLRQGDGYFVHREGTLLGFGRIAEGEILFLASVYPQAGKDVVRALADATCLDQVQVEVASANVKAVSLYESLGFMKSALISRWFCVYRKSEHYPENNVGL